MMLPVKGYEDLYQISDEGYIISTKRQGTEGGKMYPIYSKGGYGRVYLYKGGKKKTVLIHRLIAEHFLSPDPCRPHFNHKNGDKTDNRVENLEWCTFSENMKHAISHDLNHVPTLSGEKHPNHKLTQVRVDTMRADYKAGVKVSKLAVCYGVSVDQVRNIIKGKAWKESVD